MTIRDPLLYTEYIGVLSLLGRISSRSLTSDDRYSRDFAMEDANDMLARYKSGIRFAKSSGGTYAAHDHKEER